jgi:hypothetical protein
MRKRILAITLATVGLSGHAAAVSAQGGTPSAQTSRTAPSTETFERQMKAMQEIHQKIQTAKTPAERAALMDEHMKLMSSSMGMMQQMRATMHGMGGQSGTGGMATGKGMPPDLTARNQLMEKRMEMMEHMMQMMMDRLPAAK